MTSRQAPRPPYSVDLLADLHADNLPDEVSTQLWPLVRADPDALAVIEALDTVTARLAELGHDHNRAIPIPDDVSSRIEQALAAVTLPAAAQSTATVSDTTVPATTFPDTMLSNTTPGTPATVASLDTARARRAGRTIFSSRGGLVAAAAVALLAGAAGLIFGLRPNQTATPGAQAPVTDPGAGGAGGGVRISAHDVALVLAEHSTAGGALADPSAMRTCLLAVHADRPIIGSLNIEYDGRDAVLVVLPSEQAHKVTALVVAPTCGPNDSQVLAGADF